jgi:hypothetical protein
MVDNQRLLGAEQPHHTERNDDTRRAVVDAYFNCGLLEKEDADNLKALKANRPRLGRAGGRFPEPQ